MMPHGCESGRFAARDRWSNPKTVIPSVGHGCSVPEPDCARSLRLGLATGSRSRCVLSHLLPGPCVNASPGAVPVDGRPEKCAWAWKKVDAKVEGKREEAKGRHIHIIRHVAGHSARTKLQAGENLRPSAGARRRPWRLTYWRAAQGVPPRPPLLGVSLAVWTCALLLR